MTVDSSPKFVHLHSHSTYSLLDGFSTMPELIGEVSRLGQHAVAVTDHGNMYGAYEFQQEALKAGVKPIFGFEAYVAPSHVSHTHHGPAWFADGAPGDTSGGGSYTHMLLFAKNNDGLKDLFKLITLSHTEGFWKKNRISVDLLRDHAENLIGTTGCPSGEIQTLIRLGKYDQALEHAAMMQSIFGQEDYYLELMDHDMNIELEREVLADLLKIGEALNIPLLATNDNHYTTADEAEAHEHLLCIGTRSMMDVPTSVQEGDEKTKTRFAFDGAGYYLKSYEEMALIFPPDKFPGALSNTVELANRCNALIEKDDTLRPLLVLPEGHTEESYLREQAYEGLARRGGELANSQEYIDRLEEELSVIIPKNYSNYFLVISDFMRWAKFEAQPPIPLGPGRGSAAGSLLAWTLDITDPDPIRHGLLFSRFLNPERDSPPDIDFDVSTLHRKRLINYVIDKYGADKVSFVATFGKILAKNAVKDVNRVTGGEHKLGQALSDSMPGAVFGKGMLLKEMYDPKHPRYDEAAKFRDLVKETGSERTVELAKRLEGRVRQLGVHAAAIIVSSKPVHETVPQWRNRGDGTMITSFDYPQCEDIGLLKFDVLGLKNLDIIDHAVRLVELKRGIKLDLPAMLQGKLDDPKVYELLTSGDTEGLFQIEGGGMQSLLKLLKPTTFEDISAVLSLYRPGPMGVGAHTAYALRKNGQQEVDYIHPELTEVLTPILGPTYGVVVYQEQVQLIAQKMAGYTLGEADNLRRAMGKKKREILEAEFVPFEAGAIKHGFSKPAIKAMWEVLVPFADYAFNKSHTVAYGLITYVTAFLKAHYPAEYMSALMTTASDDKEKTSHYLEESKRLGMTVLPPDVQHSLSDYAPLDEKRILFGFSAISGISETTGDAIVATRDEGGEFKDFSDFLNRIPLKLASKSILEPLAKGGALDGFGHTRKGLVDSIPGVLEKYKKGVKQKQKQEIMGEDLFANLEGFEDDLKPVFDVLPSQEWEPMEKLKIERDMLGLYVSAHPLDGLKLEGSTVSVTDLLSEKVPAVEGFPKWGQEPNHSITGLVVSYSERTSRAGKPFGMGTLEDRTGTIKFMLFGKTMMEFGGRLKQDDVALLSGYSQTRDGTDLSFIVSSLRLLEFSRSGAMPVRLRVTLDQWEKGYYDLLRELQVFQAVGDTGSDVIVSVRNFDGSVSEEKLPFTVNRTPLMITLLRELFGVSCIGRWRARVPKPVDVEQTMGAIQAGQSPSPEALARARGVLDGTLPIETARAELIEKYQPTEGSEGSRPVSW